MTAARAGAEALAAKGWWLTHRFLLLRRATQLAELALCYLLVGGRADCSWVCPINPVTDLAVWLRQRLGLRGGMRLSRNARFAALATTAIAAVATGTIAWDLVNPVSMLQRGLIFGLGAGRAVVLAVLPFDRFVAQRGWCGHLCPVGASDSLLGRFSPLRVSATQCAACNDCADRYAVRPAPTIIEPTLEGSGSPVIGSSQCTDCGRCIDLCSKDVFPFGLHRPRRVIPISSSERMEAT